MQPAPLASHSPEATILRSVDEKTVAHWLEAGRRILVIDVRESDDIERAPSPFAGALAIPAHQLFVRHEELPREMDAVIVLSREEEPAKVATFTLGLLGYAEVYSLDFAGAS